MNYVMLAFWTFCLLEAAFKPCKKMVGKQVVHLNPGEFIFGRKRWAEALGMTEKQIRLCVRSASDMRSGEAMIFAVKRASKYTIYKIINWEAYQQNTEDKGQQKGHELGRQKGQQGASRGPQLKNIEEGKERNIVNFPDSISHRKGIPYQKIIEYLNAKIGKSFRPGTKETQKTIRARWNEGFRFEDFIQVIDTKAEKWLTDEKMVDYLRPQTLFGTKFESYLQESATQPSQSSGPPIMTDADRRALNA